MDVAVVMVVFGITQVVVGATMARGALAARARLAPWRGRLIVAVSAIALGTVFVATRGAVQVSTALVAPGCIVGFTVGSIVSIREGQRYAGNPRADDV